MSIYVAPRAKAILGPGAAAMMTQPSLSSVAITSQKFMYAAAGLWKTDPWVRAAEKVVSGKFSTVEWHLEDDNDQEIDDEYPDKRYLAPWELLEQPQARLLPENRQINASTRRELWAITSRHMGVCGSAFWYLDQLEPTGKTPLAILYIAPWRMWPNFNKTGQLTGWVLDWDENKQSGTPLELNHVLQFSLEPPDEGAFAPGLVQSAMSLITLDQGAIGHAQSVLSAGGRLAGIMSPKTTDASLPDDKFQQLVRDFRTINELPDAARRTNIVQGPIDFNRTAATMTELELIALMAAVRDDILALEGVPFSQLGGSIGTGLNSGDVRKYDEAALWQNAIHQRIVPFTEKVQFGLLDRYKTLGIQVELEIDEPEFDDDGPRFDLLQKSTGLPMRNVERRALIGLEPFGDPVLDNAIWLPTAIANVGMAPDENGNPVSVATLGVEGSQVQEPNAQDVPPVQAATATAPTAVSTAGNSAAKASLPPRSAKLLGSLTRLRTRIEREHTDTLRASLRAFLDAQKRDIVSRLRTNAEHIARKPRETDVWFAKARWDRELKALLARPLTAMAQNVNEHITTVLTVKAAPVGVVDRALSRGAARVTGINETTRDKIKQAVARGAEQGYSVLQVADLIEGIDDPMLAEAIGLDVGTLFDEYRAELIARTELMDAYNGAALGSYGDAGVEMVEAIDGDEDQECIDRVAGNPYTLDEADAEEDHPNGTLDWVPIISEPVKAARTDTLTEFMADRKITVEPRTPLRTVLEYDEAGRIIGWSEE